MQYDVKLIIDEIEVFGNVEEGINEQGSTFNLPSHSNVQLKNSTSLNGIAIGTTATDQISFTLNNPWKSSFDGSKIEMWISELETDETNLLFEIEDEVEGNTSSDLIDEGSSDDVEELDETGEDVSEAEIQEALADEEERELETYSLVNGEDVSSTSTTTQEEEEAEWIKIGSYFVYEQNNNQDSINIKALDGLSLLSGKFNPAATSNTIQGYYNEIKTSVLDEYGISIDEYLVPEDMNITINWNLNCTYRDALGYLAGLVGGYITCDSDDTVGIDFFTYSDNIILKDELLSFNEDSSGERNVQSLTCNRVVYVGENIITSGDGDGLTFTNPFMTQTQLDKILPLFKGIKLTGGSCSMKWRQELISGQYVRVMSSDEYRNYLEIQNKLEDDSLTEEEITDLKIKTNTLGCMMAICNQTVAFGGEAISNFDSLCYTSTVDEVTPESPSVKAIIEAGKTATNYITEDDTGALVISRDTDNYKVKIDADSVDIYDGEILKATFGETTQIVSNDSTLTLTGGGVEVLDKNNEVFFSSVKQENVETITKQYTFSRGILPNASELTTIYEDFSNVTEIKANILALASVPYRNATVNVNSSYVTISDDGRVSNTGAQYNFMPWAGSSGYATYQVNLITVTGTPYRKELTQMSTDLEVDGNITSSALTVANSITQSNNDIIVDNQSQTMSVPASDLTETTYNISKTGYTPIGIVGYSVTGTGSTQINVTKCIVEGDKIRVCLRNLTSTARSSTFTYSVLYQKSAT